MRIRCLRKANNIARVIPLSISIILHVLKHENHITSVVIIQPHTTSDLSFNQSLSLLTYFSSQLLPHHAVLQELRSTLHGNMFPPITNTTHPHCFSLTLHLQASQQRSPSVTGPTQYLQMYNLKWWQS